MRLLLEALDDLAETDKKDEYNPSDQDGLEQYTGVEELYSALALADKYEVTRLFKTWCLFRLIDLHKVMRRVSHGLSACGTRSWPRAS